MKIVKVIDSTFYLIKVQQHLLQVSKVTHPQYKNNSITKSNSHDLIPLLNLILLN